MSAIVVEGLRKSYGPQEVLRGVDLVVGRGEIVALLGPNGAGKTTTVEILEGHRQRTSGRVDVLGHDPGRGGRRFRSRIGIVLQSAGVEGELRVGEAVRLFGSYYADPVPAAELLDRVGLADARDRVVRTLSGGQRRRLDLALGLVGRPELVFLDEPTTGFDPGARRVAWQLVRDLRAAGTTVLLTTHYLDEAEALADRVAILLDGQIVADGPPADLGDGTTEIRFRWPAGVRPGDLPPLPPPFALDAERDAVVAWTTRPTAALDAILRWAAQARPNASPELAGLIVRRPTLEDVYLGLVHSSLDG